MKIVVCIKQVVTREWQVRVNDAKTWVRDQDASWELNEPDAYALEEALRLKEKHGGEVIVVSAGPARVTPPRRPPRAPPWRPRATAQPLSARHTRRPDAGASLRRCGVAIQACSTPAIRLIASANSFQVLRCDASTCAPAGVNR